MNLNWKLFNSATKHIKKKEDKLIDNNLDIEVVKEESFAFQVLLKGDENFLCQLNNINDIHYLGLNNKIRIDIDTDDMLKDNFKISFLGYIQNDDKEYIGDAILNVSSKYIEDYQMLWIEGKIPANYNKDNIDIKIKAYFTEEYKKEVLIKEETINISILDYILEDTNKSDFFLDLWQHPCNWARHYEVDYFSDEHFIIIENFLEGMSKLGQKVIDLIVTDYPWAGQRCYEVYENHANLFEMNIVKVSKKNDEIMCDFRHLDRYVELCHKYNINKEINLFGLIGNWDAFKFKSPLKDYKDAIRINYYNEDTNRFDYIKEKEEFSVYLQKLFNHLEEKGWLEKSMIIADEPDNIDVFMENVAFIENSAKHNHLKYKCAIHHQEFFEKVDIDIQNLSLNTCELINNIHRLDEVKKEIEDRNGIFTWFSCCFPDKLNVFLDSPLLESRMNGWFTYYCNLDGFLRWSYGIWPGDTFNNATYKKEKWKAGDMFLVYPGKDLKPMDSVRSKNLLFGIQDFNIFKDIESKLENKNINNEIEKLIGKKSEMKFIGERAVQMNYSLQTERYMMLRSKLIREYLKK